MKPFIALAALLPCAAAAQTLGSIPPAAGRIIDPPRLSGDYAAELWDRDRAVIGEVWEFVKTLGQAPAGLPAPTIYFSQFDLSKQSTDWTRWQKAWSASHPDVFFDWLCNYSGQSKFPEPRQNGLCADPSRFKGWLAAHPEIKDEYPFPKTFRAFHYDGTDRIQINPYTTYEGSILQGIALKGLGLGYYVTGHEMLHYVLDSRGVPGPTHHCLYVTPGPDGRAPMEKLALFLIAKGYANPIVERFGFEAEKGLGPCRVLGPTTP
ncbi:MAG: hypothetical protein HY077_06495 [Elusimicrobia bacterium]|nr:hypothetical protein [Elusimicrobiota bacterium]